jgi:hypothetical protein
MILAMKSSWFDGAMLDPSTPPRGKAGANEDIAPEGEKSWAPWTHQRLERTAFADLERDGSLLKSG